MGLLSNGNATLLDIAKRVDSDGKIALIAEVLNQQNEILNDMQWVEGNLPTGHRTTVRTGLPPATWRLLNYGVQPSKSTTAQITDTVGMLEAYSEVDKALADLNGNSAAFRFSEDQAFLEGMNQTMASALFYGDTNVNPERFVGLAPRFAGLSTDYTKTGYNIIDAGGTGSDNTSIWLVVWGPNTCHGIYPKGSKAGFQHRDLGEQTIYDSNNGRLQAYRTHYKWDIGLTVRDWRYIVRIANVDYSDLTTAGSGSDTSAKIENYMALALERVPNLGMGRAAFYCNRLVAAYLRIKLMNKANTFLHMGDYREQKEVMQFMGVPVRRMHETVLLNTESRIT